MRTFIPHSIMGNDSFLRGYSIYYTTFPHMFYIFRNFVFFVFLVVQYRISVQPLYFINHTPTVLYNQKYKEYEITKNVEISTK